MIASLRPPRAFLALAGLVVVSVTLFAVVAVALRGDQQDRQATAVTEVRRPDGSAGTTAPTEVAELPDAVWDLEYDAQANALYLVSGSAANARLYRFEPGSDQMASWALPPSEYSGVHREVRALPSGEVVVSADYALVRVRPTTGESTRLGFSLEVDGALPGALDPNSPLAGTWVSAIGLDEKTIIVGRQNVPYLTVVDSDSMDVAGRIELPDGFAGARDIAVSDGLLYVLAANGDIGVLSYEGLLAARLSLGAYRVEARAREDGGPLLTQSDGGVLALTGSDASPLLADAGWQPIAVPSSTGGYTLYDRQTGSITRFDSANEVIAQWLLPLDDIPPRMGQDALSPTRNVTDLTTDKQGSVWYVTGNGRSLWKVNAP